MKRIADRLRLRDETSPPLGVGNFKPGVTLLIGEQAANPTAAPEQEPFCSELGCSGWLNQQLDAHEIDEAELFWVNALNNDGSEIDLPLLLSQLQPSKIVALGKVAAGLCSSAEVDFTAVPHPQFWKRFHHHDPYMLMEILKATD